MNTVDASIHLDDQISNAIDAFEMQENFKFPQELRNLTAEMAKDFFQDATLPKDSLGLPSEVFEKIYAYAYNLFQAGRYQEAIPPFKFLQNLDPFDARYAFSIAASYHYLKDYLQAINYYVACTHLDKTNPLSFFYLYDCLLHANFPYSAYNAIYACIILSKKDARYEDLLKRAEIEANAISHKLNQLKTHQS